MIGITELEGVEEGPETSFQPIFTLPWPWAIRGEDSGLTTPASQTVFHDQKGF